MRKPLLLIYLLLMAFTMAAVGQVAQTPDPQKKFDEEDKQRQHDYYQAYLNGCKTNEIRTLWFLYGERHAFEADIPLRNYSVTTRIDVYDHAIQGQHSHKIEPFQLDRIEKLASSLPPSEKNVEYLWTLFVATPIEGKVEIFTYDRREPPAIVRRIFDLAGAYLPEADILQITKLKHTPWEPTTIPICDINMVSSAPLLAFVSNCEIVTMGSGNGSVSLIAMRDKSTRFIGPKLDMYLHGSDRKGSDKIFGFLLVHGDTLRWGENVLVDYPTNVTNVAELTKSTKVSIDMAKLADFYDERTERTSLRVRGFSEWAFTEPYTSTFGQKVKIVNASVETNLLKIKIENPVSNFHGEAWIDLNTKEVVRGIESGKVVFFK